MVLFIIVDLFLSVMKRRHFEFVANHCKQQSYSRGGGDQELYNALHCTPLQHWREPIRLRDFVLCEHEV